MNTKRIMAILDVDHETALQVKGLVEGRLDPEKWESAERRQRQAYHPHDRETLVMEALNEILEGYGVEYLQSSEDTPHQADGIDYVNFGDPYIPTVMYDHRRECYRIGCWGDIVERQGKRFQ